MPRIKSGCEKGLLRFACTLLTFAGTWLACDLMAEPYFEIPNRNVFGLKPQLVQSPDLSPPAAPRPKVTLIGITTILGRKIAFLTVATGTGSPRESSMLAEGQ